MYGVAIVRLERHEVLEIVALYRRGWGVINISGELEISEKTVERVLLGQRYAKITGGRIMQGKRPAAKLAIYRKPQGEEDG